MNRHKLTGVLLALVVVLAGCQFIKSMGRTAAVAGGGAAGGLIGTVGGPLGIGVGAGLGAGSVYAMQENAELRSGSLQGDEARDAEIDRLKSMLLIAQGDMSLKDIALGQAGLGKEWARKWFWRVLWWAVGITALFIFVRWRYLTGRDVPSKFWSFIHAFIGRDKTRRMAFGGIDPLKVKKAAA